jgi:zinc transporter 9
MFAASLLVGALPLMLKSTLSSKALPGIQVLGMGLLVGAALAIIIPEGVATMYAADEKSTHAIGLSLLAGFALMLLVENVCPHPTHPHHDDEDEEHAHNNHSHFHTPERRASMSPMLPKEQEECSSHATAHGMSATLGLVIHGLADGIALGASSLSDNKQLGLVVFLAVLVHKGPSALGLTTTLLSLHLNPAQVRRRLVIFSLAAPTGALVTYALVSLFGASADHGLGWWTGAVLLFSGGSFLYVATVIQPISETGPDDHCHHPHHEVHRENDVPRLENGTRTGLILLGMALPAGMALLLGGHAH